MFSNHDVYEMRQRFDGVLIKTPCVFSAFLSEITGAKVYLKLENMQKTGSFKERGAFCFLLQKQGRKLSQVVTASAGNHAQAVALHAARLGIPATIFMPLSTPNTKVLATERLFATVKLIGQNYDEAFAAAVNFAQSVNAEYIHAYNDPDIILGQATVALEIFSDLKQVDVIFVPVGGGGLISGIAQFVANLPMPTTKIIGVEASDFRSMAQAIDKGQLSLEMNRKTIAEGIAVRGVGELTAEICRKTKPTLISVSDYQIQSAIMLLLEKQKIVAEGAGAAAVSALFLEEFRQSLKDKTVVVIVSGGNIDISLLARLTAQELVNTSRLSRMSLVIKDTPGSLSALLQTVSRSFGNIIDIRHERSFADIQWNEVLVDVTVEIKDEIHEDLMLAALTNDGYVIRTHKREINGRP